LEKIVVLGGGGVLEREWGILIEKKISLRGVLNTAEAHGSHISKNTVFSFQDSHTCARFEYMNITRTTQIYR
jgi:hypothetical protein